MYCERCILLPLKIYFIIKNSCLKVTRLRVVYLSFDDAVSLMLIASAQSASLVLWKSIPAWAFGRFCQQPLSECLCFTFCWKTLYDYGCFLELPSKHEYVKKPLWSEMFHVEYIWVPTILNKKFSYSHEESITLNRALESRKKKKRKI